MKIIIDTSSWVALVRYYLPFDSKGDLPSLIKKKITDNEVILLSEVLTECKFQSKGIVVTNLPFINKTNSKKTDELIPTKKFYNLLENQFCNQVQKRMLSDVEFENRKQAFLTSADAKIILKAIHYQKSKEDIKIVTEETSTNNDSKVFKKIPVLSNLLNIKCITLPELITSFNGEVDLNITRKTDRNTGEQTLLF